MQAGAVVELDGGQYRLSAPLAASSYGVLWRALREDGLRVALKLVNAEQMARAHPSLRTRWVDAAANEIAFLRCLAPWDERHIVRLLDSGRHAGMPAMALELLGPDLARHVAALRAAGRRVPPAQALAWLAQVNGALARVHSHGWHYLDLKPANLLLHPHDGGLRLIDFGTSCRAAMPASGYGGTAAWQAPEQFFPAPCGAYEASGRSDYFSLGALFYYLVTGEALAFGRACAQAWREHGHGAPALLLARHGTVPPTLQEREARRFANLAGPAALALLVRLLAARADERPASALEISRMIGAAGAENPATAPATAQARAAA